MRPVLAEHREFEAPEGYEVGWATPEDIAGCDPFHTELDEAERADGVRRLGLGHRAVAIRAGELVVFTMWENPRNLNVPGLMKRALGPHQSFIYKAFTSPEHRGKKLYQAGMRFVLSELAKDGKTELVGYAHVDKQASPGRPGAARLRGRGPRLVAARPRWTPVGALAYAQVHLPAGPIGRARSPRE